MCGHQDHIILYRCPFLPKFIINALTSHYMEDFLCSLINEILNIKVPNSDNQLLSSVFLFVLTLLCILK